MDVINWLLDSDPALRWQVMRDLTDAPAEQVAAERARVADEGWGARLLALQQPSGQWQSDVPKFSSEHAEKWWRSLAPEQQGTLFPEWTSTTWSLALLKDLQVRLGMAMLFITHDLGIVRKIADTVCVMKQGSIVEQGTCATLLAQSGLFCRLTARRQSECGTAPLCET